MAESSPISPQADRSFTRLGKGWHIALRTFRKNGEGVDTPVWCVADDGRLLVMTNGRSGKVKRIATRRWWTWAPATCTAAQGGPWLVGEALLVSDPDEIELAFRRLRRKYGLLFTPFSRLNGSSLGYGDAILAVNPVSRKLGGRPRSAPVRLRPGQPEPPADRGRAEPPFRQRGLAERFSRPSRCADRGLAAAPQPWIPRAPASARWDDDRTVRQMMEELPGSVGELPRATRAAGSVRPGGDRERVTGP
jgi:PPOX class probable F420-dependent enzyme